VKKASILGSSGRPLASAKREEKRGFVSVGSSSNGSSALNEEFQDEIDGKACHDYQWLYTEYKTRVQRAGPRSRSRSITPEKEE